MTDHEHDHNHVHDHEHEIVGDGASVPAHRQDHEHPHAHAHTHTQTKNVLNRLAKAIGHLEKVRRMVEEGEDCSQVLIQLAAVRGALSNTSKVILRDHIEHCLYDAAQNGDRESFDELCRALDQFI